MNQSLENQWLQYLETPRQQSEPVKLDKILVERMRAFMKAKKTRSYRIKRTISQG